MPLAVANFRHRARCRLVAVTGVPDLQADKVAAPEPLPGLPNRFRKLTLVRQACVSKVSYEKKNVGGGL